MVNRHKLIKQLIIFLVSTSRSFSILSCSCSLLFLLLSVRSGAGLCCSMTTPSLFTAGRPRFLCPPCACNGRFLFFLGSGESCSSSSNSCSASEISSSSSWSSSRVSSSWSSSVLYLSSASSSLLTCWQKKSRLTLLVLIFTGTYFRDLAGNLPTTNLY